MDTSSSSVLEELLGEELASDATTVRGLTNHLPMALVAKQRLGANDDELRRFATAYSRRLVPLSTSKVLLDRETWKSTIGDRDAGTELRKYFARRIAEDGVDTTLRAHLPALLPGVAGAGFHGVIRLAYAIEASSSPHIAAGLAYFAEVAKPLAGLASGGETTRSPEELLTALSRTRLWSTPQRARLIDDEMRSVANREGFGEAVASLTIDAETAGKLEACALRVLASTDNFTALHGVTGLAAVSVVRPWIEDSAMVDRYAFQALIASYLSIGAPALWSAGRLDEFASTTSADLAEVRAVAAYSDDEHVAKLVYTALGGFQKTREPLYLSVAARAAASGLSPDK
jgi:hypothetical protein